MLFTTTISNELNLFFNFVPVLFTITGDLQSGLKLLGAGIAALGVIGAGIGQGMAAQGACIAVGRNPEASGKIITTMTIGAGIAETGAIYAFVISILLIFAS